MTVSVKGSYKEHTVTPSIPNQTITQKTMTLDLSFH